MKLNIHCNCGNFRSGEPFTKDQCAVCWGRDNYHRRKAGTLVEKVKQVSKSTAAWLAAGSPLRTAEQLGECFDICLGCEHYRPHPIAHCGKCGCFLSAKARMATETCPLGKWPTGEPSPPPTPPESPTL